MSSLQHKQKHCMNCNGSVLAQRKGTNHILHLILTIITGGLWAIVWIALAIKFGGWLCPRCGMQV
jgi:ribosomal protein S27AE